MSQSLVTLVIFSLTLVMFVWQKIPVGLTAFLSAIAMVISGSITPYQIVSAFSSDAVIMVTGCIIMGNAIYETGGADDICKFFVMRCARSEKRLLLTIILVAAVLSSILSNTAVVAMFLPLLASAAHVSQGKITKKGTYMALGIASIVGGNCTLAGSTPQLVSQSILASTEGVRTLGFWELGRVGWPLVLLLLLYYWAVGFQLQKKVFTFAEVPDPTRACTRAGKRQTRPCKNKKRITLFILLACIVGFSTEIYSTGTVAAIAAGLCILTNCISPKRAFQTIDWNTVLILGGAACISMGINNSGLIDSIAGKLILLCQGTGSAPFAALVFLTVLSTVLGNIMSHTATAATLTPLAISLARVFEVNPITYVVVIIIGCNMAFVTPISTPPLTMTLIGGYRFTDYLKIGGIYNCISVILVCILTPVLFPL